VCLKLHHGDWLRRNFGSESNRIFQQRAVAINIYYTRLSQRKIGPSSTLSGSKVRPLITQTSRWHANEQDLETHSVDNARPVSVLVAILQSFSAVRLRTLRLYLPPRIFDLIGMPPLKGTTYNICNLLHSRGTCVSSIKIRLGARRNWQCYNKCPGLVVTDIFWTITVQDVKIHVSFNVLYWEAQNHTPV